MDWSPCEGDKVEVRAQATLYEPRGDYQLLVEAMRQAGQGGLYQEFLQLKAKLESEGLYLPDRKLSIPRFPKSLGIITSLQAAALHDVLKTLETHWPCVQIIIYPTSVQGSEAASSIRNCLNEAISRDECDVLIIVRGGGSLEDLHPYNDEQLARAIDASKIPVITGIGHETDFTIADFVADARAPTPTAAAKMAVPDRIETSTNIFGLRTRLNQLMMQTVSHKTERTDGLSRRVLHPGDSILNTKRHINHLSQQILLQATNQFLYKKQIFGNSSNNLNRHRPNIPAWEERIKKHQIALSNALKGVISDKKRISEQCIKSLKQLNPEMILSRGYSIVTGVEGNVLFSTESLNIGSMVEVKMFRGHFKATVNQAWNEEADQ